MTNHMLDLVRNVVWHAKIAGPVLEIGSYIEAQQEHLNLRTAFPPGTPYMGVDVNEGPGVDRKMNIFNQVEVDEAFGLFTPAPGPQITLCLYVIEHVWEIVRAAAILGEMWKRNPESWLLVATHQNQPYHGTQKYGDFWRLTTSGFCRLMDESAGIPDTKVFMFENSSNPEDILAIRQPVSVAWPEEAVTKALEAVAKTTVPTIWGQYR